MAIGAIEQLTSVSRISDYSTFKQNEDNKGYIAQTVISEDSQKDTQQRMQEVTEHDNADYHNKSFDAKEKGENEYRGDGGKQRKEPKKREQVIVNGHYGFDIKI